MDIVEDVADAAALLLDDDANAVITIKMKLANFVTHRGCDRSSILWS
jgi:hypothetical protein